MQPTDNPRAAVWWLPVLGVATCLAVIPSPLRADPLVLTEKSAGAMVLKNNRELQAARMMVAEAEARSQGAGRLSNPEFEATVAGGRDFEGRVELGLTQRFPLTARLRLEKQRSRLDVELARAEIAAREQHLENAAREIFLRFLALRESAALTEEHRRLSAEFQGSLERRVGEGLASSLDVEQASLQTFRLEASRDQTRAEETERKARLATLLGLKASADFQPSGDLTLPASLPTPRAPGERADLHLARLAVETGTLDIALAGASRWDDIGVGLFVEGERFRDEPEGIETEGLLGLKLSIPLPVWQNGRSKVQEKRATQARLQETVRALELAAQNETEMAYRNLRLRYEAARKLEATILPTARRHVVSNQAAFDRGEISLEKIFRAREQLADLESASLDARAAYHLARQQWIATLGKLP